MFNYKKIAPATYLIPQEGDMCVPGLVIATQKLLEQLDIEEPIQQVRNVACLPGIVGYSIAMPDVHWGYGFPIGGVAAMDAETGIISPGGVGYDINCGVRLALIPLQFSELGDEKRKHQLLKKIFHLIPSGVGKGYQGLERQLSEEDYNSLLIKGARWSVEHGFGFASDLDRIESNGVIEGANSEVISLMAKHRGRNQLGSIGSGNHFVEIGEIEEIYLPECAAAWGIIKKQTYALIHSGSRGFGHQVCQDYLDLFIKAGFGDDLPDKQLVAAPINSLFGQEYFQAMSAAANFAFNNRQQILHWVRKAFHDIYGVSQEEIHLLYDVCHNIAKFETHSYNGKKHRLCVHRKGATRSFGPGNEELAPIFQKTGQPVLIPGDMGRASYVMAGLGNPLTWSSCCHGAGRALSRIKSLKAWKGRNPIEYMENKGVEVIASSNKTIAEEMPDAYKNVDDVVAAVQEAKLANMVCRLKPKLVIKG